MKMKDKSLFGAFELRIILNWTGRLFDQGELLAPFDSIRVPFLPRLRLSYTMKRCTIR